MKRVNVYFYRIAFLLLLAFTCALHATAYALEQPDSVTVGILQNDSNDSSKKFVAQLEVEVENLLGKQIDIRLPQSKRSVTGWSVAQVDATYQRLVNDPDVSIIVACGPLNAAVLSRYDSFPKPVILYGILDYNLQSVPLTEQQTSGIHNLTYVLEAHEFRAELSRFKTVYPYKHLTIVIDRNYARLVPNLEPFFASLITLNGSQSRIVYYDGDFDVLLSELEGEADALFWGGLASMPIEEKHQLIAYARAHKLPSYSYAGVADVRLGALAGSLLETNWQKVTRRIALNIERIIHGEDPATFPTLIDFPRRLTLNMKTATEIDFSPNWQTLARAEQIAIEQVVSARSLSFESAVQEGLNANLGLDIQRQNIASSVEDINQARAALLPSLQLSVGVTQIDEDRAGAAQVERTADGTLSLRQSLFSEPIYANLDVQEFNLEASREAYREAALDTILTVGEQYLSILKAQANERIFINNLGLVRKNFEVAEFREQIGYAGNADVYRLEAELAIATGDLLEARSVFKQAKIGLNEQLNRPIDEDFSVEDIVTDQEFLFRYGGEKIRALVRNQKSFDLLARFLVSESLETVPELQQIKQSLAAQERILKSQKRKRWLPNVDLAASVQENFDESGAGAQATSSDDTSWNVNAQATWSLFEGGSISSEVKQAQVDVRKLRQQLQDVERQLELKLRKELLNLRVLAAELKLSRLAADATRKNYDLIQDAYRQGVVTITSLLDAQNSALAAEQSAANAVYAYYSGVLNLERTMGNFSVTSSQPELQDFLIRLQTFMAAQP